MKKYLFFLLILLSAECLAQTKWYTYDSELVSIEFPARPEVAQENLPDAGLQTRAIYRGANSGDMNVGYTYTDSEFDAGLVNSSFTDIHEDFFRIFIDSAVQGMGGVLTSEKIISMKGFPGREVEADMADGAYKVLLRTFLVNNHMHSTLSISKKDIYRNTSLNKFHSSLKLK